MGEKRHKKGRKKHKKHKKGKKKHKKGGKKHKKHKKGGKKQKDYTLNGQRPPDLKKDNGTVSGPKQGEDFSAQLLPFDNEPVVLNDDQIKTGMNCPCLAKCDSKKGSSKTKCEEECAATCQNKKKQKKGEKKDEKGGNEQKKGKVQSDGKDYRNDYSKQLTPFDNEPVHLNDEQIKTGMNCPCFAKCDSKKGSSKTKCEQKCETTCRKT